MAKPILSNITVFDAIVGTNIPFVLYGKADSVNYYVYDNETGEQVATGSAELSGLMANKIFPFPAGKLTNKLYPYFMKIETVYQGEKSELSDPVLFYCKTRPTLAFANLSPSTPNTINTSASQFELNYTNKVSEGESLSTYQYFLYDSNKELIMQSKEYYGDIANGFIVDGFTNNGIYYLRGVGSSINGYQFDTGYLTLQISYTVELNRALLSAENDERNGVVRVKSTIAFMDGVGIGDVEYVHLSGDNYAANLTDGSIAYTIPYELEAYETSEYNLRVVVKPIIYKNFMTISNQGTLFYVSTNIRAFTDYTDENEKFYVIIKGNGYVMQSNYLDKPDESHFISVDIAFQNGLFSIFIKDVGEYGVGGGEG